MRSWESGPDGSFLERKSRTGFLLSNQNMLLSQYKGTRQAPVGATAKLGIIQRFDETFCVCAIARASGITASGRASALIKLHKLQHIVCHETTYRPRTITGYGNGLFRTEQKVRSVEIPFLLFIISPGHAGYLLCTQPVTDGICNLQLINRFKRLIH